MPLSVSTIVTYVIATFITLTLKGGFYRFRLRRRPSAGFVFLVFVLTPIAGFASSFLFLRSSAAYLALEHYHLALFAFTSILFTIPFATYLFLGGELEEFMDGFKTFPLLSPIMCFTGPALWKDALTKFGLTTNIQVPSMLLFGSGFLFISALFLFWIGKAYKKKLAEPAGTSALFGPTGVLIKKPPQKQLTFFFWSTVLTFVGLPALFTAVLDLAFNINKA